MNMIEIPDINKKYYSENKAFECLKKDYGIMCFLGGKIKQKNPLTYHHIFKRVYGDYSKEDPLYNYLNGALLCRLEHSIFNEIEANNLKLSRDINNGFIEYKKTKMYPLIEQMRDFVYDWIEENEYEVVEGDHCCFVRRKK